LLLTALPGRDAASTPKLEPARLVGLLASALRRLHALDAASCPFDGRLDMRIGQARALVTAGLVNERDFDDVRLGRSARDVLDEVIALRPAIEDVVVTHGDACLPNYIVCDGAFAGFVDCGRLGVADHYQDLALACRSIRDNLGEAWEEPFLAAYGVRSPDRARVDYYQLLEEMF
jgi:aminoglycoside 3'-phosphotransferase-2